MIQDRPGRRRSVSAFTLLEILVVIAILGLLVGLVVTNVGGALGNSQKDVAKIFVNTTLKTPIETYRQHMSNYPTTEEGLNALIMQPAGKARWRGPYLDEERLPRDPWDKPYQYKFPGTHNPRKYDVWSMGPDGISGNEDDIGNWPGPDEKSDEETTSSN